MRRRGSTTIDNLIILISKSAIGYVVFVVFLFSVPIYKQFEKVYANTDSGRIVIGETIVEVEIADSSKERKIGLSDTEFLNENEGMLFTFDSPGLHGIWMNSMNFSIDIIWLDETQQVVFVKENVSPDTYPKVFKPTEKSLYVLEVPAGFAKKEGIKIGDQMTLF